MSASQQETHRCVHSTAVVVHEQHCACGTCTSRQWWHTRITGVVVYAHTVVVVHAQHGRCVAYIPRYLRRVHAPISRTTCIPFRAHTLDSLAMAAADLVSHKDGIVLSHCAHAPWFPEQRRAAAA